MFHAGIKATIISFRCITILEEIQVIQLPLLISRQPVAIALCAFAPRASLHLLESLVVARQQSIGDRPFKTVDDVS